MIWHFNRYTPCAVSLLFGVVPASAITRAINHPLLGSGDAIDVLNIARAYGFKMPHNAAAFETKTKKVTGPNEKTGQSNHAYFPGFSPLANATLNTILCKIRLVEIAQALAPLQLPLYVVYQIYTILQSDVLPALWCVRKIERINAMWRARLAVTRNDSAAWLRFSD